MLGSRPTAPGKGDAHRHNVPSRTWAGFWSWHIGPGVRWLAIARMLAFAFSAAS